MPRISLIEDLTKEPVPPGSQILVEFDPTSQWFNASLTIAAGWLRSGGKGVYNPFVQAPEDVRSQFKRLGFDSETLEKEGKLSINDYYALTLGQIPRGNDLGHATGSLKVADESVFALNLMKGPPLLGLLVVSDDESTFARFNDEKAWVELELTRWFPAGKMLKATQVYGVMAGVCSDWAYRRLEGACDGVVEFKLDESSGKARDLVRIRTMRNVHFDREWHELKIGENFEVTLEK